MCYILSNIQTVSKKVNIYLKYQSPRWKSPGIPKRGKSHGTMSKTLWSFYKKNVSLLIWCWRSYISAPKNISGCSQRNMWLCFDSFITSLYQAYGTGINKTVMATNASPCALLHCLTIILSTCCYNWRLYISTSQQDHSAHGPSQTLNQRQTCLYSLWWSVLDSNAIQGWNTWTTIPCDVKT